MARKTLLFTAVAWLAALSAWAQPQPEFVGSVERWACTYQGYGTANLVTAYFGLFSNHLEGEYGTHYVLVQNDRAALVTAESQFGVQGADGADIDASTMMIINRETQQFSRVTFRNQDNDAGLRHGRCVTY